MVINFCWLGKTKDKNIQALINEYSKRLRHYVKHEIYVGKEAKHTTNAEEMVSKEADLILAKCKPSDYVVLLDERGKHMTSPELAKWIQHKQNISLERINLIVAGAYGAHPKLKERADFVLSLSHFTLTHDMVRILILEQIYRAFTILRREKYHNEHRWD